MLSIEINDLKQWHRKRCFAMEQRKRGHLSLGGFLRFSMGWSLTLPAADRKQIETDVAALIKKPEGEWAELIIASQIAWGQFETIEDRALKEMQALAKKLPVWDAFGADVRGFGLTSLAVIVGEAGDLANYPDKSKLWKRMGLAVLDGRRQGHVSPGLSRELRAAAFKEHGYVPKRRSQMWNIGDALIKAQVRKIKDDNGEDTGERTSIGLYGETYLSRKAAELANEPDMQPMKAHLRAQRYMEKRLLKHLWQAWRRTAEPLPDRARLELSAAEEISEPKYPRLE